MDDAPAGAADVGVSAGRLVSCAQEAVPQAPSESRSTPPVRPDDHDQAQAVAPSGPDGQRPHAGRIAPGDAGCADGSRRQTAEALRRRSRRPLADASGWRHPIDPGHPESSRSAAAGHAQPARPPRAQPLRRPGAARTDPAGAARRTTPRPKSRLVKRAYEFAERAHEGQVRRSGDPYITHPLAVAGILADLGMDAPTLAAALLHDTVEDTEVGLERIDPPVRRAGRRSSSTGSPSSTRSRPGARRRRRGGPRPRRARRSARWSSRWRATRGCSSSSSPTACTTCARCASCRRTSRSARPARRWRSTRRWPTGWA